VEPIPGQPAVPEEMISPVDVAVGVLTLAGGAAVGLARRTGPVIESVVRTVSDPPMLPSLLRPGRWLDSLARRGAGRRVALRQDVSRALDVTVPTVLDEVLRRADLTAIVLERVDLDTLIRAVLDRLDLAELTAEVMDVVDLPEIIRESTGSMASDTVRGARMQGITADQVVSRVRNRLLLRRGRGVDDATAVSDPAVTEPPGPVQTNGVPGN